MEAKTFHTALIRLDEKETRVTKQDRSRAEFVSWVTTSYPKHTIVGLFSVGV